MPEYAFDIKLAAVVRVVAESEEMARGALPVVLDCMNLEECTIDGINSGLERVVLTEASIMDADTNVFLIEVDGKEVAP